MSSSSSDEESVQNDDYHMSGSDDEDNSDESGTNLATIYHYTANNMFLILKIMKMAKSNVQVRVRVIRKIKQSEILMKTNPPTGQLH